MKSFAIVASALLFVSGALADPMQSPKLRGHRPDTPTDNPEAVFAPIVPCRAFSGQNLSAGMARHFVISGPTGTCGVPASATAVAISLTATSSSGNGSITAYYGATPSSTRALSFHAGQDETASATIGLGSNRIALRANGSSTKIAGDVTGYYAPQIEAFIDFDGTIFSRTARIVSVTRNGTGSYNITVDRDVEECAVQVTPTGGHIATGDGPSGTLIVVNIYAADGATHIDDDFNLSAHC